MQKTLCLAIACAALGLAGLGCDDGSTTTTQSNPTAPQASPSAAAGEALPAGLMLTQAPADAKDVMAVKQAKAGDEVVIRGRVGGRVEPFVEGRAAFQVVDLGQKSCKEMEDHGCNTSWDYCCDPKVNQKSASVQVVGADGKPLRVGLKGVGGLQPLSEVTIKGTVVQAGESGPVLVNATGIHVKG